MAIKKEPVIWETRFKKRSLIFPMSKVKRQRSAGKTNQSKRGTNDDVPGRKNPIGTRTRKVLRKDAAERGSQTAKGCVPKNYGAHKKVRTGSVWAPAHNRGSPLGG